MVTHHMVSPGHSELNIMHFISNMHYYQKLFIKKYIYCRNTWQQVLSYDIRHYKFQPYMFRTNTSRVLVKHVSTMQLHCYWVMCQVRENLWCIATLQQQQISVCQPYLSLQEAPHIFHVFLWCKIIIIPVTCQNLFRKYKCSGIILGMGSANERRHY